MVLRTFPTNPAEPDLVAAAQAEGIPVQAAAQALAQTPPGTIDGMKAWVLSPESYGAGVAEWKAAWPVLAGRSDAAVRLVMRYVAAKAGAVVLDV